MILVRGAACALAFNSGSRKVPNMSNNKSFRFVLIGQTFDNLDGKRYEKTNSQYAKPFGGGKAVKLAKDFYCVNVSEWG